MIPDNGPSCSLMVIYKPTVLKDIHGISPRFIPVSSSFPAIKKYPTQIQ